jgi:membrane protease subunit HflC
MTRSLLVIAILLLALWARSACYSVDASEFVYVTRFGEPITVRDGGSNAGLHFKAPWPVDSVIRIDRRVQSFDLPAVESLTRDPVGKTVDKTLAVDAFVTWKIPDATAADLFVKTVRTPEQARKILAPIVNGRLAALISTMPLEDLIGVADDPRAIDERNERVRRRLLGEEGLTGGPPTAGESLRAKALDEYGIQVIDIRIRRFSYPEAVRSSIAERIRSERAKKVADYESDARKRASDIITDADRAARTIEATARAEKTTIESKAQAEAAVIRSAAYEQDREFYLFLESIRSFRKTLASSRDLLLLSTKHPLLRGVLDGPPKLAPAPMPKEK